MRPPLHLRVLLLLLLLFLFRLPQRALAVSDEARRIETTFTLVVAPAPAPAATTSPSANATPDDIATPQLLPSASPSASPAALAACPRTLSLTKIRTYRGIRGSTPSVALDGILWEHVVISGTICDSSRSARTTTYFLAPALADAPPDTPPDATTPFFLRGIDNSALRCGAAYSAKHPFLHFYTDNLPRFRNRLVRDGLLAPEIAQVQASRGDLFVFLVPVITPGGDVFARPVCVLAALQPSRTPSPSPSPSSKPVCFSGRMRVAVQRGGERGATGGVDADADADADADVGAGAGAGAVALAMRDVRVGATVGDGLGTVVSFSHAARHARARMVRLHVRFSRDNGTAMVELSGGHFVISAHGEAVAARDVRVGDALRARSGRGVAVVGSVEHDAMVTGLYAPVTTSGRVVVNDVVCSCYTDWVSEREAHALLAPVRAAGRVVVWDWCAVMDALRERLWPV